MTFLCDKYYMQGTIVAMAATMPEVILTEYGLLPVASSGSTVTLPAEPENWQLASHINKLT